MKKILLARFSLITFIVLFLFNLAKAQEADYPEQRALAQSLVDEAVELIQTKGEDALLMIEDENGKFNTPDTYVFITSESGADLVNPAFRDIEGLPLENYTEPTSKDAQMTIVNAVKDKDTAWVEYLWPRPKETKPSRKISYLRKIIVNGKVRIVGAGFYPHN